MLLTIHCTLHSVADDDGESTTTTTEFGAGDSLMAIVLATCGNATIDDFELIDAQHAVVFCHRDVH